MIRLEEPIKLIETFLFADIEDGTGSYDWVMEKIKLVLSMESEFEEICGNICCIEIKKKMTKVIDTLNPDESNNNCQIETLELKELIDIWVTEYKKYSR